MSASELRATDQLRNAAATLACLAACCSLMVGLIILKPVAAASRENKCGSSVTVSRGDTLSLLARRCKTTVPSLIDANPHIRNPDILPVGAVLTLVRNPSKKENNPSAGAGPTPTVIVEPSEAVSGARVTISASNLPPRARVWIKGGNSRSSKHHLTLRGARTDAKGELRATLRLPKQIRPGRAPFIISVEVPRTGATLLSPPLDVSPPRSASKKSD